MVVAKERAGRMVPEEMQHAVESEESEHEPLIFSPIPVEPDMYYYSYPGSVKKNLFDNREPGDLSVVALIAPGGAPRRRLEVGMDKEFSPSQKPPRNEL